MSSTHTIMNINFKQNWLLYFILLGVVIVVSEGIISALREPKSVEYTIVDTSHWEAPSLYVDGTEGFDRKELIYGEDLIANTSRYFGPKGSVAAISNGMNCQNCHLQAGTKEWGNNYSAVHANYPKFRERSGSVESISKRVNDCLERSLNGQPIDTACKEMKAMVAYISWLGKDVKHGVKPVGAGIRELTYLDRAADPSRGAVLYTTHCQSCHGNTGEGTAAAGGYLYPPLWGEHSYNTGAGLFRLSRLAGYILDNMPYEKTSHEQPLLSEEDAWDLAAFVNSQSRPHKTFSADWPNIAKKPVDHPFGPYADPFSELQHKYGPFQPIVAARKH